MERIRHRKVVERPELWGCVPEQDEPLGFRERQRPQEHCVDDGEDRDGRADGDGERQQGEEREALRGGRGNGRRQMWRRSVAHRDPQPHLVGELLQLPLPQTVAAAVRTATVSRDQQPARDRIRDATHPPPPPPQRLHRERRRVVIDADAHPAGVVGQVVHAIRNRLAEGLVRKVVDPNRLGVTARTPLPPRIFERADELLFLRVHRHHRLAPPLKSSHPAVDVVELRVPVWMLLPLQRLTVRLQAVTQRVQQPVHRTLADAMARLLEFPRQPRRTAAGPAQRPRRVAARRRIDEPFQRRHQAGVVLGQRLAARARPAQPSRGIVVFRPCGQFLQARADRRPRQPRRLGHPRDSTASECPRLHRGPTPPRPFVEQRFNRGKLLLNHLCEYVLHGVRR